MFKHFFVTFIFFLAFLMLSATPARAAETCSSQQEVNAQFRPVGGPEYWISGQEVTGRRVYTGNQIDINCFAKTGYALLDGGYIDVITPDGVQRRAANNPEIRNYYLDTAGTYTFVCASSTIANCTNSDSFTVLQSSSPRPTPSPVPSPRPTPTPTPTPTPAPAQQASCDSLQVVGGQGSLVPANIVLRARGSDNRGNIQSYRFYFGDGQQQETSSSEITHTYNSSGSFIARADVKDSLGNWRSSSSCETSVSVGAASIESHKSDCSDVFITANNNAKAPSTVKFEVSGYDNKGNIQQYRMEFGNGITKDSDGRSFEQIYTQTGTYEVRGYIKNSQGNWVGGDDNCRRSLTIGSTTALTVQPSTGTPTILPIIGLGSGILGSVLTVIKHRARQ